MAPACLGSRESGLMNHRRFLLVLISAQRLPGQFLERRRIGRRNAELSRRQFLAPQGTRIAARYAAEDYQRLEVVAVGTGMVVVLSPEIDLTVRHTPVWVSYRDGKVYG